MPDGSCRNFADRSVTGPVGVAYKNNYLTCTYKACEPVSIAGFSKGRVCGNEIKISDLLSDFYQCQGYAGTLQVSWLGSGICRYPAGILQVSWPVSGICRYPRQGPGYAGTLQEPWSGLGICRTWLTESLTRHFSGCINSRLSVCTCVPHREDHSMEGSPF